MSHGLEEMWIDETIHTFRTYKSLADKAIAQVADDRLLHWSPNPEVNSIAVIVQHLSGNMISRWTDFLTADGEKDWRDRDAEFVVHLATRDEILAAWERGWEVLFTTVEQLTAEDLTKTVYIRQEPHSVVKAILRQVSHCAYHVGQIVHIAKELQSDKWESLSIPRKKS
ncbi:DUF1572 domain-containing protein [Paenibacillus albiflavus]|uniref:DUF1572 domain-containing protein n=1 Tax=Paenibacillus albiflavus TaxID=2545760 RepID=A0A4R4DYN0_9BACL|nr:DUF1572 family protein [Paenibacillus albiflavus]TCZ70952.1 DUF1572 domain-containing protein [Paenibacillus albiflavus]